MSERWSNWAGEQICAPVRIEQPRSEQELVAIVRRAAGNGLRVRAVGSGHSFTDCACTDGVMIDTSRMQRILEIDRDRSLVTVEGGIRLHQLGPVLAAQGLALKNQGDIDAQSVSGAISTATHGTGAGFGMSPRGSSRCGSSPRPVTCSRSRRSSTTTPTSPPGSHLVRSACCRGSRSRRPALHAASGRRAVAIGRELRRTRPARRRPRPFRVLRVPVLRRRRRALDSSQPEVPNPTPNWKRALQ